MEDSFYVYFGEKRVGKVQVTKQGLYYRFFCRCKLAGDVVCRLVATSKDKQESLGIVVPVDDGFGLETRIPIKRIGEEISEFHLVPKHEIQKETFFPISPEEPFAYIARLKEAYLVRRNGTIGAVLRE